MSRDLSYRLYPYLLTTSAISGSPRVMAIGVRSLPFNQLMSLPEIAFSPIRPDCLISAARAQTTSTQPDFRHVAIVCAFLVDVVGEFLSNRLRQRAGCRMIPWAF